MTEADDGDVLIFGVAFVAWCLGLFFTLVSGHLEPVIGGTITVAIIVPLSKGLDRWA